VALADIDPE
jgi:hypothetical protein